MSTTAAVSLPDAQAMSELMEGLKQMAHVVQSAPLTRDQLMQRWGITEEKTFQRWCEELGLCPFQGRGRTARFRITAVLRAEQKGEKLNGGEGA